MNTHHARCRRTCFLLSAFICVHLRLLPLAVGAPASPFPKEPRTTYYGIFFGGGRIGSSKLVEAPTKFRGKSALKVDSSTHIRIAALGTVEQQVDLIQYQDESGAPLHLRFTMGSGGHTTRVLADFFPDRVECELDSQGSKSKKRIPIPRGVSLIVDPNMIGDQKLKVGEKRKLHLFEPLTLQILPMDVEVLREEKLDQDGKSYLATVVKAVTSVTGESTSWVTEDGQLLQSDSLLGIRMVREHAPTRDAQAAGGSGSPGDKQGYTPPIDLAVATAIRTETTLPDPRKTRYLRVRITGIPERSLILIDSRQKATIVEDPASTNQSGLTAIYEIQADDGLPAGKQRRESTNLHEYARMGRASFVPVPIRASSWRLVDNSFPSTSRTGRSIRSAGRYLREAPYLEVNDPRIQRQAKQIVGEETDPARKAAKIRAWIHGRMKADTGIGVPRAATDILVTPKGVCRDYAILFTALARAAGVPTRLCAGTLYFRDSFYYHAWNECLVDEERGEGPRPSGTPPPVGPPQLKRARGLWRPYDATLPTDFVDATHIKFAQGDATEMFQAVAVVGKLRAEILEYR